MMATATQSDSKTHKHQKKTLNNHPLRNTILVAIPPNMHDFFLSVNTYSRDKKKGVGKGEGDRRNPEPTGKSKIPSEPL